MSTSKIQTLERKQPSTELMDAINDAARSFMKTGAAIDNAMAIGRSEGFTDKETGRMIRDVMMKAGFSDRSIRRALPESAKHMERANKSVNRNNVPEQYADKMSANSVPGPDGLVFDPITQARVLPEGASQNMGAVVTDEQENIPLMKEASTPELQPEESPIPSSDVVKLPHREPKDPRDRTIEMLITRNHRLKQEVVTSIDSVLEKGTEQEMKQDLIEMRDRFLEPTVLTQTPEIIE